MTTHRITTLVSTGQHCPRQTPPATAAPDFGRPLSHRALVVEDNALIAMEAEAQLYDLGATRVDVAGSVGTALEYIGARTFEFVLLDVGLGSETSRSVADALDAQGVPYVFATGYGEIPWPRNGARAMPMVTKPVDAGALADAVRMAKRIVCDR